MSDDVVWYHGTGIHEVVLEDDDGRDLGPLPRYGSGVAGLARSLLAGALGPVAVCNACAGTAMVTWARGGGESSPYDPATPLEEYEDRGAVISRCKAPGCDGGLTVSRVVSGRFAEEFAGGWGGEWRMHRAEIIAWHAVETPGTPAPGEGERDG